MPVKDAAPFLEECIESVRKQSYSNWELIAINDHSKDGSAALIRAHAKKDARITLQNNNGKGIIPALRLALNISKGSFITRMDADDKMAKIKLEELIKLLLINGDGFVSTGCVKYFSTEKKLNDGYINYENWINGLTISETNFTAIYKECVIPSPCWMISKENLKQINAFNASTYPEDYDLAFRMKYGQMKIAGSKKILHYWRDYPQRTSRNDPNYSNNAFPIIKVHYFIKHELNLKNELMLWGAGKKAKAIAKLLIEKQINFSWITNNPKKIGKQIYGQLIKDSSSINSNINSQVIIAIASKEFQPDFLKATQQKVYRFC